MIHEKNIENGRVSVIDDRTKEVIAVKITFEASKICTLCGAKYVTGDRIGAMFPVSVDFDDSVEHGGPWEPGGYTSHWLRNNAIDIMEIDSGSTVYRAPYTKTFLGKAGRAARDHAMRSVFRRFMERGTL
jgi:hypothetical protein